MSRTNESRHIKWHKTCKCEFRLDSSVYLLFSYQGVIWNPSNCECECDKSCDIGEYLDYKNCKCRKRIIDKLVEECSENIDGNEMLYNETLDVIPLNVYKKVCTSCMIYILLFVVFLITSICICCVFIYFYWYLNKDNINTNFSVGYLNILMAITKQMDIKNRTYYFYNDLIKLFDFDPNMLKLDKKIFRGIYIYHIGYVTKKEECKINSENTLYSLYKIDGFIEEKGGNKYLNIAFTDNNDEVLKI